MKIGVQTFTVRKSQKKSIEKAYLPLIELGIKSFEVSRIDFNRKNALKLKELKSKYNIEITSIQVKPKYIFGDCDNLIEFCKITDCQNIVISMLPFSCILGKEERFYSFIGTLDQYAQKYATHGITLAYHHHNWEYITLSNGKSRMDELLEKTEKIKFVHDTYWTARSGIDPVLQIQRFGKRLLGIHLRDLTFYKKGISVLPKDTYIGGGVIDFKKIFESIESLDSPYLVIEQNTNHPYNDIKKSYEYCNTVKE